MITARRVRLVVAGLAVAMLLGNTPVTIVAAVAPTIIAIASGHDHTCALTSGGGVKCWGYGRYGTLGTGTTTTSVRPVNVVGLTSGVTAITAGYFHSCALLRGGDMKCWGFNRGGKLGNGKLISSSIPVDVVGLTRPVVAIAAGGFHTCALTDDGGVKCWGENFAGQLGNGSTTFSSVPGNVAGLTSGVTAISAGFHHSCALTNTGHVRCWGLNASGALGNGTTANSSIPVNAVGLPTDVRAVAAGASHTCALAIVGRVDCWGDNVHGQLGHGSTTFSSVPATVAGFAGQARQITAGAGHTCAVTFGGRVRCWGWNSDGRLGNGKTTDSSVPVDVVGLARGIVAVAAGGEHTCALLAGGVKCWGYNAFGQLGNGTRTSSPVPVDVDFTMYRAIDLRASEPAGAIASGTVVTFSASVSPIGRAGEPTTIRFEIYRMDDGVWHRTAHRDLAADATGRATLRWTFVTAGPRYVRARALANATYGASPWSPRVPYVVGP